jgi:hypothetical protein
LGSSGFIFLDDRPWPFLVRQEDDGEWWLYYWGDSRKEFATMRKLSESEVERFRVHALPAEQAALYLPNGHSADTAGDGTKDS